jgi:hypothetical protein
MSTSSNISDSHDDWSKEDEELDDLDDLDAASFDLVEIQDATTSTHGSLKSFETKDCGLVYYSDDPTGFTITVERLL